MNLQREFATINGKLDEIAKNTEPEELELESLGEWLDEWLDLYKVGQIKDSTIYQYRLMIKRIPEPLKLKPLGKLQPRELQRFLYSIRQTRQRQHVYCLLKDAFHKAFVLRMLEFDPMLAVEKPKHIKKERKAFDREQEARFVKACNCSKYGDMYLVMLYTGIRKGEALALECRDIDLHNRVLHITKAINDLNRLDTPKSKAGFRKVPIFDNLYPYLQKYAGKSNRRIFPIVETTAHIHFHMILKTAGLEGQGFTTHSLRHTFLTRLCETGVSLKVAQKWAGHCDAKLTLNVYTHCNADFEAENVKMYNEKLKSGV